MKKISLLFFIVCSVNVFSQNLLNGLQGCYPLNSNAQNYASTGASFNGTLVGVNSGSGHTGVANTAYLLNGNIGSYIELPGNQGLKNNSVFFSGWFRIDSLPASNQLPSLEYLVYTSNGCMSNFEAYSLHVQYESTMSQYVFCLSKCGSDCGTKPQLFSSTAPGVSKWYHLCFYIDDSVMKLYVNGVLESSTNHNVQFGYQQGKNVFLGVTNESNFNYPFKGAIDDVRFYDRDLTQQEITILYTQDPACIGSNVSIGEFNTADVSIGVFPNPGSDKFYIKNLSDKVINIYDLLGNSVDFAVGRVNPEDSEINLQQVIAGVYLIKVTDAHGNYLDCIKLIVNK